MRIFATVPASAEAMESELAVLSAHLEAATHRQLSLIRELEPSGIWAMHGAHSYAGWLSWRIGLAPGAAREKIHVARALGALPAIDDAFRAAKLSYSKVRALTRVADATNEAALLEMALSSTAAHLELICRGIRRVERDEHGEVVDRTEPPARWVRERAADDGMVRIEAQLHPDEAALVWKAIELARGLGGEGTPIGRADALLRVVDAFVTSQQREHRCGAERAQVVVHLRADALAGAPDALAGTLEDGSRVPAETLRRVACDATLLAVRTDEAGSVIEVGRRTRVVSGSQRRALRIRDRTCRFPGCTHHAWLDAHHVEHWAHGGATTMSNLVLLCPSHHRLVHEGGFSIARFEEGGIVEVRRPDGVLVPIVPPLPVDVDIRRIAGVSAGMAIDDGRCCLAGMGALPTSPRVSPRGDRARRDRLRVVMAHSTARAPRAWVLNLDAELELEAGPRYTPGAEMQARVTHLARGLKATMDTDDVVVAPEVGDVAVPGLRGFAWCPTPRALELLHRAGAIVRDAPSLDTLRRAHERGFAFALAGDELPGVLRATDLDAVASHVAVPGPTGAWLLKRAFGVAGRGQRLVRPGALADADRAWVLASLRRGAVYVEPRVELARELSVHAWARARTDVRSIREQRVAGDRSWISSHRISALEPAIESALVDITERVGAALIESGYHGPFGIDAYQWRTSTGTLALRTLSEVNPRYCMSWDADDDWG